MMESPSCLIGEKLACPVCKHERIVPKKTPRYARPTECQLDIAEKYQLTFPKDISKQELSELLSHIPEYEWPATEKQKTFARNIGLSFEKNITKVEMSKLLDKKLDKIPPSEGQLELAKEKGIEIPGRCSYKKMSDLIDKAMKESNP